MPSEIVAQQTLFVTVAFALHRLDWADGGIAMVMLYVTLQSAFLQHISTLSNRTLGISAQQVTPAFANLTIYDMNQFIKVRIVRRLALSGPFSQWPFLPCPPAPPALASRRCAVGSVGDCAAHWHTACEMSHGMHTHVIVAFHTFGLTRKPPPRLSSVQHVMRHGMQRGVAMQHAAQRDTWFVRCSGRNGRWVRASLRRSCGGSAAGATCGC